MGIYLSTLANDKGTATVDPDENYAREVMRYLPSASGSLIRMARRNWMAAAIPFRPTPIPM